MALEHFDYLQLPRMVTVTFHGPGVVFNKRQPGAMEGGEDKTGAGQSKSRRSDQERPRTDVERIIGRAKPVGYPIVTVGCPNSSKIGCCLTQALGWKAWLDPMRKIVGRDSFILKLEMPGQMQRIRFPVVVRSIPNSNVPMP